MAKLMVGHKSEDVHDLYHVIGTEHIAKILAVKEKAGMFWSPAKKTDKK
ncbi:hypothetical protein CCAX7_59530 [Capsulimonas corticalis]|uniref:Uncharacterized protein n=1 Tax=Capsulimonas corticalis TaxID=2219043 RepID=A0A402CZT2_9BACT|nr:hypothetical protein [Capsulimonas corticalis]BDI33902.1 hypothetical protein CCAX7_59530 [Capsulimonas corticalis]